MQEGIREKFIGHLGINYQSLLKAYGDRWPEKKDGVVPGMASLGWHYFSREEFLNRYQAFLKSDEKGKLFSQMLMKEADEQLYEAKACQEYYSSVVSGCPARNAFQLMGFLPGS